MNVYRHFSHAYMLLPCEQPHYSRMAWQPVTWNGNFTVTKIDMHATPATQTKLLISKPHIGIYILSKKWRNINLQMAAKMTRAYSDACHRPHIRLSKKHNQLLNTAGLAAALYYSPKALSIHWKLYAASLIGIVYNKCNQLYYLQRKDFRLSSRHVVLAKRHMVIILRSRC